MTNQSLDISEPDNSTYSAALVSSQKVFTSSDISSMGMQYLEKDKTRGVVPRVMQKEAGQVQGGLRYLGQLFKQLQVPPCLPPCNCDFT